MRSPQLESTHREHILTALRAAYPAGVRRDRLEGGDLGDRAHARIVELRREGWQIATDHCEHTRYAVYRLLALDPALPDVQVAGARLRVSRSPSGETSVEAAPYSRTSTTDADVMAVVAEELAVAADRVRERLASWSRPPLVQVTDVLDAMGWSPDADDEGDDE